MARYRMLQGVAGVHWSWAPGHEFDKPPKGENIKRWLDAGFCEELPKPKRTKRVIETAEAAPAPEKAARVRKPRRGR